jgi:hypothetical protein
MSRPLISSEKLVKISLALNRSDLDRLAKKYPKMTVSAVVRLAIDAANGQETLHEIMSDRPNADRFMER